jgi:hypothetical protein
MCGLSGNEIRHHEIAKLGPLLHLRSRNSSRIAGDISIMDLCACSGSGSACIEMIGDEKAFSLW